MPSTLLAISKYDGSEVFLDVGCRSGNALADVEAFLLAVELDRMNEKEASPTDASSSTSNTAVANSRATSTASGPRPTARVLAGRELRDQLLRVARLRHSHKMRDADELWSSLGKTPADAAAAAREDGLAKQRARELRDCCFSMGGLSLTQ